MDRKMIIKCKNCGWEYMPGEIFIPEHLVGRPKIVNRDSETGEIINVIGTPMDPCETFICEHCNKEFKVYAKIQFIVNSKEDFDEEYSFSINRNSLFLSED